MRQEAEKYIQNPSQTLINSAPYPLSGNALSPPSANGYVLPLPLSGNALSPPQANGYPLPSPQANGYPLPSPQVNDYPLPSPQATTPPTLPTHHPSQFRKIPQPKRALPPLENPFMNVVVGSIALALCLPTLLSFAAGSYISSENPLRKKSVEFYDWVKGTIRVWKWILGILLLLAGVVGFVASKVFPPLHVVLMTLGNFVLPIPLGLPIPFLPGVNMFLWGILILYFGEQVAATFGRTSYNLHATAVPWGKPDWSGISIMGLPIPYPMGLVVPSILLGVAVLKLFPVLIRMRTKTKVRA